MKGLFLGLSLLCLLSPTISFASNEDCSVELDTLIARAIEHGKSVRNLEISEAKNDSLIGLRRQYVSQSEVGVKQMQKMIALEICSD